jgi:cytochrome c oxidase assembly protein subunit 15
METAPAGTTWLNRFAWLTALATLGLIGTGGLVTSHGVGMSVPDWPTTYGYNMFLFPISQWVGGVFYEHTHRLWASTVGLLTTILAIWMWRHKPAARSRKTLRWLGVLAFLGVSAQGILGGLRVTLIKDELGIFHGTLAQMFLVLVFGIALYTSKWWPRIQQLNDARVWIGHRRWLTALTALVFLQLALGATMRHQHAGLAVPDFPLAYGKLWPPTDAGLIAMANQNRMDAREFKPITAAQIHLHMTHRLLAYGILAGLAALAWRVYRQTAGRSALSFCTGIWVGMALLQATLGAMTVWSNKAADVATLHVTLGASTLVYGSLLALVSWRLARTTQSQTSPTETLNLAIA